MGEKVGNRGISNDEWLHDINFQRGITDFTQTAQEWEEAFDWEIDEIKQKRKEKAKAKQKTYLQSNFNSIDKLNKMQKRSTSKNLNVLYTKIARRLTEAGGLLIKQNLKSFTNPPIQPPIAPPKSKYPWYVL